MSSGAAGLEDAFLDDFFTHMSASPVPLGLSLTFHRVSHSSGPHHMTWVLATWCSEVAPLMTWHMASKGNEAEASTLDKVNAWKRKALFLQPFIWKWINRVHFLKLVLFYVFFIIDSITNVSHALPFTLLHPDPNPPPGLHHPTFFIGKTKVSLRKSMWIHK